MKKLLNSFSMVVMVMLMFGMMLSMTNKTFAQSQNSNPNSMLIDTIVSDDATFDLLDNIIFREYTEGDTLIDLKVLNLANNTIRINAVCYMSDDSLMWDFYSRSSEISGISIYNTNGPYTSFYTSYIHLNITNGNKWLYTRRDLFQYNDTMTYKVMIIDQYNNNNSYNINFKMLYSTKEFAQNPSSAVVCSGEPTVNFHVAQPTESEALQWQLNSGSGFVNISNNATYSGANSETLTVSNADALLNNTAYRCVSTYNSVEYFSHHAVLTVKPLPTTSAINGNPNPENYEILPYMIVNTTGSSYEWLVTGGTIHDVDNNNVSIMWGANGFGSLCVVETGVNGCVGDPVCLEITVGENEISDKSQIKIYPNPASKNITINTGNQNIMSDYNVKIENILGQTVYDQTANQQEIQINVKDLGSKGTYFVKIIDRQGTLLHTEKLILN